MGTPGGASQCQGGPLIDAREVARRLGMKSAETIREWARRGKLPHLRVGRCFRFRPEDLAAWIETRRGPETPEERSGAAAPHCQT